MPITVKEVAGSRRGGWLVGQGRSYTVAVRVITGDPTIGPRAALRLVGIDAGATYASPIASPTEYDYGCFLNSIEATEENEDGKSWVVTLTYGSQNWQELNGGSGAGADPAGFTANPLNAPPTVKWGSETEEVACELDRYATPILNAAGDPFDPPITKPASIPICTVTRMLPSFDPNWLIAYKDHVNASDWMGFPAGTVLCKDMTADRTYVADWGYMWEQTLVFAFRPIITASESNPDAPWETDTTVISAGWSKQVLNAGLRQRVDDGMGGFKAEQILIDGSPASSEVYLKEDGTFDPNADPNYLTFDIYEEANFDDFNLPPDLFSIETPGSPVGGS